MTGANTDFILGTDHAIRLHTTQLRLLDGEALIAVVEFGAQCCYYHLLTGSHVGSATYNLHGVSLTEVNRCHVHVVRVGMRFAGEHLTDNDTFEATLDGLYLLHAACLQTYRGERSGYLIGSEGKIDIFL